MLGNGNRLDSDELGLESGLAILKEHGDDLLEISLELVEGLSLAMSTGETRHVTDQEAGIHVSLDNRCVVPHLTSSSGRLPEASSAVEGSEGVHVEGAISDNGFKARGVRA